MLATLASGAPDEFAHASLLESLPRPGARLADPPSRIALVYTEPLHERLTELRLVDAVSGRRVPATSCVTTGRRLELHPSETLDQGAYRLDWRSISTIDGHIREGSVGFGVGTAALGATVELRDSPREGARPTRAGSSWLFYAALFFFAGGGPQRARPRPAPVWHLARSRRSAGMARGCRARCWQAGGSRGTLRAGLLAAVGAAVRARRSRYPSRVARGVWT